MSFSLNKEAIQKIIFPAITAILIALIFWMWSKIKNIHTIVIPENAVMAFNLASCPDGWDEFDDAKSRFIVGVGQSKGFSPRTLMEKDGAESIILTTKQMPKHSHDGVSGNSGHSYQHHQYNNRLPGETWNKKTGSSGENEPIDIMPPYLALRYCIKLGKN